MFDTRLECPPHFARHTSPVRLTWLEADPIPIRVTSQHSKAGLQPADRAATSRRDNPGPELDAALRRHGKKYRKAFKECRRKFSSGAVHRLRVETRRLWSLLDLVQPLVDARLTQKAGRRFKKVFRAFARLRDTQVLLQSIKEDVRHPAEWRPFAAMLRRREAKLIRRAEKRLKKAKLNQLEDSLEAVRKALPRAANGRNSDRENGERLLRIVDRAFGNARRRQRTIDPAAPATIHRMRIAFKKFRYVFEAVQEIVPKLAPARRIKEMQSYQTLMGRIQDADVLLATVQKFHSKQQTDSAIASAQRNELLELRSRRIAEFLAAQDRLPGFWPPRGKARPQHTAPPRRHRS